MRIAVTLVMLLFVVSTAYAASVSSDVMKKLDTDSEVSVIVKLKDTPAGSKGKLLAAKASSQVISSLGTEFKKDHEFTIINGFSGKIDADTLEQLRNDPRVESIDFDMPVHAMLAEAVPLVNGTRTWQVIANGINITGQGETVCIIDTGVN